MIFDKKFAIAFLCSLALFSSLSVPSGSLAQARSSLKLDSPPGYKEADKKVKEFDQFKVRVSCKNGQCKHSQIDADGYFSVEGRVSKTKYTAQKDRLSPLAVARNYENALKAIGAEAVVDAKSVNGAFVYKLTQPAELTTWIVLDENFEGYYDLIVIEQAAMKQVVTASQISSALEKQGVATLYINFDLNKFDLKADGQAAVKEIAQMLKIDTSLKLSIEGHTDNVGDAKANKLLSENRAKVVMQAVVAQGIAANRLSAVGFGMEKPVADNRSEDARAKNRRVELVKK